MCKELLIPPGTQNYVVRMRLYDTNKQLLCLTIRIILRSQGALKILISAPYWLVNKTGKDRQLDTERTKMSFPFHRCDVSGFPSRCSPAFTKTGVSFRFALDFPARQCKSRRSGSV